ncbi:RiPP maturation radical SAM C-methyltransferase [Microbispora bryophytorum]|uniref:RiPP maturation radical SAM C-methyltransferase n=1 Tax=Microbispora bryophytorum TaxID=1460882 RepID=UPI0033C9F570
MAGPSGVRASCAADGLRVALVTMPFASHRRPSLQLGLLAAIARDHGHTVSTFHFNLDFAALIEPRLYDLLCEHRGTALGEWLFAEAAFGRKAPDAGRRMPSFDDADLAAALAATGGDTPALRRLRGETAGLFIEQLAGGVAWDEFDVVGFTTTFQQNVASLALAARLKRTHPGLVTLFGGANVDGVMGVEMVRAFDCVDYALSGEADRSFPMLLRRLADGASPDDVPGLLRRGPDGVVTGAPSAPTASLDDLPVPDYDEYFERAERLGLIRAAARRDIDLPFESARGCWWGQRRHCTFCGLNGQTMRFRSKSPQRVIDELTLQARRYRSYRFEAVDNILDTAYLEDMLPKLVDAGVTYDIFYEVKANLRRDQLALLRRAGVRRIQPGIESLSSHVLRLMRKGVRASDNVNLLRWASYYGLSVSWNLIWGFPGETEEDYWEQARLAPHLVHLEPPGGAGRVWLERFSPMFTDRAAFPMATVRPESSLDFVYPDFVDKDRLAYFFDYRLEEALPEVSYGSMALAVKAWQTARTDHDPQLRFFYTPGLLEVVDTRHSADETTYTLRAPLDTLYIACSDRPRSVRSLVTEGDSPLNASDTRIALDRLCDAGLAMRDRDRYLALALPATGR